MVFLSIGLEEDQSSQQSPFSEIHLDHVDFRRLLPSYHVRPSAALGHLIHCQLLTPTPSYGESHCRSVGCIVDGVPPGMELTEEDIQPQMTRRRPGQSNITTPRNEKDRVLIQSGTEFGVTLGTPIGMMVLNEDQRPKGRLSLSLGLADR